MRDLFVDLWVSLREAYNDWVEGFYAKQFGSNERIQFYESLIGVIEDSIPIDEALETVEKAFSNEGKQLHPVSIICSRVARSVRGGKSLASSCRAYLPFDESSLIETGEQTGTLAAALRDCVRIIEVRQRITRLVISVFAMPTITWSLMFALMFVVAGWLVPIMAQRSDPETWVGVPAFLYVMSNVVTHYGLYMVALVVGLAITSIITLPYFCGLEIQPNSPDWKVRLSHTLQRIRVSFESLPPWSIYKVMQGSIFLLNMSVMLRTGISQLNALGILRRSASPWLQERIDAIHYGVSSGKDFGSALKLAGHNFPDQMAIHFLQVLATRKGFATSMERFANRWLDQMLKRIETISKTFASISALLMGLLMILVVIGIFQLALGITDSL